MKTSTKQKFTIVDFALKDKLNIYSIIFFFDSCFIEVTDENNILIVCYDDLNDNHHLIDD